MMKAIIIDDEKPARENLKTVLNSFFSHEIIVVGEADSVDSGKHIISAEPCDIIFLDIHLFDGNGFSILEQIEEINFEIIFVTAFNDFAIKAFRVNALDYILKPINREELAQAIMKAKMRTRQLRKEELHSVFDNLKRPKETQRLVVRENNGVRFVPISDILRCKSDNNYTEIYLSSGERIISCRTLKEKEKILQEFGFFRIHQSHLINLSKVKKILRENGMFVLMEGGDVLEVSRRKKDLLYNEMMKLVVEK